MSEAKPDFTVWLARIVPIREELQKFMDEFDKQFGYGKSYGIKLLDAVCNLHLAERALFYNLNGQCNDKWENATGRYFCSYEKGHEGHHSWYWNPRDTGPDKCKCPHCSKKG